ncbi:MAG: SDR family NAD(P)-dependent oxidoreductase [Deltaproteobacteria bacterium]|nr:SDR family NAD(P)-dependent oxidoreductase [Deltaproteobacteria bacterium]
MPSLLVIGGTSEIAKATALAFGQDGWSVELLGRNQDNLQKAAAELSVKMGHATILYHAFDVMDGNFSDFWKSQENKPDAVLCSVGLGFDPKHSQYDRSLTEKIYRTNFFSLVSILDVVASSFENRGSGLIVGISSLASEWSRAYNYTYSASKAALTAYLAGLRHKLADKGVRVITVNPGFVKTKMIESLEVPPYLISSPETVARDILMAVKKKKEVIYTPRMWRWIIFILKILPEWILKRLKI